MADLEMNLKNLKSRQITSSDENCFDLNKHYGAFRNSK